MERIKVAICMEEGEYLRRFAACLVNNYRNQLEIHMFTNEEDILRMKEAGYDVFLAGNFIEVLQKKKDIPENKLLILVEEESDVKTEGIATISRYAEMPRIMDAIGILVGEERAFSATYAISKNACQQIAIYSLHEVHLQLPFTILMANVLAETHRVLVIDLQENSGFSQLEEATNNSGMEELLALFASGKYSRASIIPCIGHYQQWDYIYPVKNSECLCEADYSLYKSMLLGVVGEMGYDCVIFNLGSRFQGFFQLLEECQLRYFLIDKNRKNWRDLAFSYELETRNISMDDFVSIDLSSQESVGISPERLANQWQWSELGDVLRSRKNREIFGG